MAKQLVTPAMVELRAAITEAEVISARAEMTKRDEARVNVLLAKIAALRKDAIAPSDDATLRWFRSFLTPGQEPEYRGTDLVEGTQTPTYVSGPEGGFLVPQEFHNAVIFGLAQVDPLLDENVVTLIKSNNLALRPYRVPGWDLSTIKAVKVNEASQQSPATVPNLSSAQLNGFTYKLTLDASWELEADDFQPTMDQIQAAYGVGFARGIGEDLVTGNGVTAPQGILNAAANSGVVLDPRITADISNSLNDQFQAAYFSVNRIYRQSPKCAWAMADKTYQWIRTLTDGVGRPLISIKDDQEVLMGKRVLITPSLPEWISSSQDGKIVFGDFSRLMVRASRMAVTRNLQAQGYVEFGKGLYTGRLRADAKVVDPTGGAVPPFTYITLEA